jgi:hypothetical protein
VEKSANRWHLFLALTCERMGTGYWFHDSRVKFFMHAIEIYQNKAVMFKMYAIESSQNINRFFWLKHNVFVVKNVAIYV